MSWLVWVGSKQVSVDPELEPWHNHSSRKDRDCRSRRDPQDWTRCSQMITRKENKKWGPSLSSSSWLETPRMLVICRDARATSDRVYNQNIVKNMWRNCLQTLKVPLSCSKRARHLFVETTLEIFFILFDNFIRFRRFCVAVSPFGNWGQLCCLWKRWYCLCNKLEPSQSR